MVVPVHLLYPGGEHERFWLEEVVAIGNDGGKPLFSWGFGPLSGKAESDKITRACGGHCAGAGV
jgi:hypothetical protein